MNPSSSHTWSNPPPPGTEADEVDICKKMDFVSTYQKEETIPRSIDNIDPFLKNPQYVEYEKRSSHDRSKHKHRRSRSRSHDRRHSRSRSRDRHKHKKSKKKRSRSKSRSYRRSRSRDRHQRHRSRSRSHSRRGKHTKDRRHRRSSSSDDRSSRSTSPSHSYRSHRSKHSRRSRSRRSRSISDLSTNDFEIKCEPEIKEEVEEEEEEEEPEPPKENAFKNDGTFLEMFKKLQEQKQAEEAAKQEASSSEGKRPLPMFGKRRGGRVLKTGMVQKTRNLQDSDINDPQDAWSVYMKEVKKYKEACCDDDSKTRPLVK